MVKNKATARLCHISWPGLSLFLICPTPFILRVPLDPARSLKKIPRPRPPVGTQTKRTPRLPLAKGKVLERPSALASKLHTSSAYNPAAAAAASRQSCLTLYNPIDGSPPGSAIPGILQARTLEWVAISFSTA